jgi:ribosomal protein L19
MVNRGLDSSFLLRDVYLGEIIERRISLYAPLIQDIKVLQKAHIHKGNKRVRRSKLYYLRDLDPLICRIS